MAPLQRSIPIQQIPSGPVLSDPELPVAEADPPQDGRLLRRVAAYAVSRGASEGLLAVRGVLLATLLGPAAFGSWALLRLSTRYASLAGLSIFRGSKSSCCTRSPHAPPPPHSARSCSSPAASHSRPSSRASWERTRTNGCFSARSRSPRSPKACTTTRWSGPGCGRRSGATPSSRRSPRRSTSIGVALARVWGLAGALAGLALANAAGFAIAAFWIHLGPGLDVPVMPRMLRVGIPLALTGCIGTALQTADRWVVAAWGGSTLLGYYAFAGAVAAAAAALSLVIRIVVFPKVYADARSAAPGAAIRLHLTNTLLPFARLFPPVLGAAGLLLGPVLARVLPDYLAAVAPARIFLLSGAATGIVNLASIGAVAAGRQRNSRLMPRPRWR
jgi:hypothetical protein